MKIIDPYLAWNDYKNGSNMFNEICKHVNIVFTDRGRNKMNSIF